MAQVFTIVRENKNVDELLKVLSEGKAEIKELICIVRHTNGDINVVDGGSTFETKCSGSKMLDYLITSNLDIDNAEYEIEEEEEEIE